LCLLLSILSEHSEQARASHTNIGHLNPGPRQCYSACCRSRHAQKQGRMRALVVNGHISSPRYLLRPLPAAPLVVHRRYLIVVPRPLPLAPLVVHRKHSIVVPRPLPRCASQVLDHGAQADARCAAQVLDRGAQAFARGAARCAPQVTTLSWCPGRCSRRRSLCVAGI
jgi:hypothetical protein